MVLGQDGAGGWIYIALSDGQPGWVDRSFTTYTGTAPVVAAPPVPATATPAPTATAASAPVVQLVAPAANSTFVAGQQVSVQSVASDNSGVAQVSLLVDNVVVATTPGGAGQRVLQAAQAWQATTVGSHVLTVIATNVAGISSQPASLLVNVMSGNGPDVEIEEPSGTTVIQIGDNITIQTQATSDAGITRIELWSDGSLYTSTSSGNSGGQSPFTVSQTWSAADLGQHTLFARAWDSAGRSADSSNLIIGVTDSNPPQLSVTVSANMVVLGKPVTVRSTATDSKGVTQIQLWADGEQVAVTSSSNSVGQYSMQATQTWVPGTIGPHTLYAVAYDSQSKSTRSPNTIVTVVGANTATPTPTNTPAPTQTPVPTGTPAPTQTPAPAQTPAPTGTPAPTQTSVPTGTLAPATAIPVPTATVQPTATATATVASTPSPKHPGR